IPPLTMARKAIWSESLISGTGPVGMKVPSWKPKLSVPRPEYVPPPGAGSPRAATFVTTPLSHMNRLLLIVSPSGDARNTTFPFVLMEPGPTAPNVPPIGEGSPTAATLTISPEAPRWRNSARRELPPLTSQKNRTSPASLMSGVKTVPKKKPPKCPPIGETSPHIEVVSPLPPSPPQPIAIALIVASESATNTPWLRSEPATCELNATRPDTLTVIGLMKATGLSVPPLVLGAICPCAARDSTPQMVPDGERLLATL